MSGFLAVRAQFFFAVLCVLCGQSVFAAVPGAGEWRHEEVRRFKAAEANQGVAADAEFFYAIDNHAIGKYRKTTGERVAGWDGGKAGRIQHLNAGVVLDGRLYCAHSNFPKLPAESSVELWDTATMQPVDAHRFVEPPGALTWAVPRGGEWFACFAHYKGTSDPARSVVVRFDAQWQRLASWSFPAELIQRFAGSSASGGAFGPGGNLFVTGHDAKELYLLGFPANGVVLEWQATIPISAEGQAFCWDPVQTNLLYSISRRAREVIVSRVTLDAATPRADAPPAKAAKTLRLLTVGNSFSANATRHLDALTKAAGNVLIHQPIVVGGASLELHWGRAAAFEQDPTSTNGLYGKQSLKQHLTAQPWDFVTIQQASIKSHDVTTYRPFAKQLHDYIRQHAPKAQVLIHQTWAYREDDPRFAPTTPKAGEPKTQAEMYQLLTSAYTTIAAELGLRRLPVGDAFYLADTDPKWGYQPDAKYDFKNKEQTALPDQTHSLHVGWRKAKGKDGKESLGMDGHHANAAGEYLGACVWYEVLFGESVVGNAFVTPGLDKTYGRFLQETAHKAVLASSTRTLRHSP